MEMEIGGTGTRVVAKNILEFFKMRLGDFCQIQIKVNGFG